MIHFATGGAGFIGSNRVHVLAAPSRLARDDALRSHVRGPG